MAGARCAAVVRTCAGSEQLNGPNPTRDVANSTASTHCSPVRARTHPGCRSQGIRQVQLAATPKDPALATEVSTSHNPEATCNTAHGIFCNPFLQFYFSPFAKNVTMYPSNQHLVLVSRKCTVVTLPNDHQVSLFPRLLQLNYILY